MNITLNPVARQPVHTVYGGADLFVPGVVAKLGDLALRALDQNGPFPGATDEVMDRVRHKLQTEPIEDYRIDFEDGYGNRPDDEEDRHAESSAKAVAEGLRDNLLPPFLGIRIKPVNDQHRARAFRTLELFLDTLLHHSGGVLPPRFVVTLPKIEGPQEIGMLAASIYGLETKLYLQGGPLKIEFLVETPQALLSLTPILEAAKGRATAAHFGAYDYLASVDIAATYQSLIHPACDFARSMMQVALGNRGIFLADGVTNILPIGSRDDVQRGWLLHAAHIQHAQESGFYQGWDVHPAQLVSRYATVYSFFREGAQQAAVRLRNFLAMQSRATVTGSVFDDLASIRGLTAYLERGVNCGAITKEEWEAYS